jgi:hypothetical protein
MKDRRGFVPVGTLFAETRVTRCSPFFGHLVPLVHAPYKNQGTPLSWES